MNAPTSIIAISLLFAHFLGDWILQPRSWAVNKSSNIKTLLKHLLVVTVCLAPVVIVFAPKCLYLLLNNAVLHGFIDWSIWRKYKNSVKLDHKYWEDPEFYNTIAIDQFLHLGVIFVLFL